MITSFASELKKLYRKKLKFPLVVVATLEGSEIPVELDRIFIETMHVGYMNLEQREESLLWLLKQKGLRHDADLRKVAGLCSDFVLADLETLILDAAKISYKSEKDRSGIVLGQKDFVKACGNVIKDV